MYRYARVFEEQGGDIMEGVTFLCPRCGGKLPQRIFSPDLFSAAQRVLGAQKKEHCPHCRQTICVRLEKGAVVFDLAPSAGLIAESASLDEIQTQLTAQGTVRGES